MKKSSQDFLLPDKPSPGYYVSSSGTKFKLIKTAKKSEFDEPLYKCHFGDVKSSKLWTRDELQEAGVKPLTLGKR